MMGCMDQDGEEAPLEAFRLLTLHREVLVEQVKNIQCILDNLKMNGFICNEDIEIIQRSATKTEQVLKHVFHHTHTCTHLLPRSQRPKTQVFILRFVKSWSWCSVKVKRPLRILFTSCTRHMTRSSTFGLGLTQFTTNLLRG